MEIIGAISPEIRKRNVENSSTSKGEGDTMITEINTREITLKSVLKRNAI